MTHEEIEKHRKRFEELININTSSYVDLTRFSMCGSYACPSVDWAWQGYLLCAENLLVELPSPNKKINGDYEWAYNKALEHCEEILESQGIKIKSSGSE